MLKNKKEGLGEKSDKDFQRLRNIVSKLSEESKIKLDAIMEDFASHPNVMETTLPKELTNMERAYLHYLATKGGFKSFSRGVGDNRQLTLQRVQENTSLDAKYVSLTSESFNGVANLVSELERAPANLPAQDNFPFKKHHGKSNNQSRLCAGPLPKVPRPRRNFNFLASQQKLPIWEHKDRILREIENNRVVFIQGSTGCGKTTQVGQYLLDDAYQNSKKVRIICTVPRRIAAITVSDRVAQERGEQLGHTVGYQIRLESCISQVDTLLAYCTSGVLLRSMSSPEYEVLKNTTHIIIDEVHERDRQTDFLLACLKDMLEFFPLKLILMGADIDNKLFLSYFGQTFKCPIIQVEGRLHPVTELYLEDILELLNYKTPGMKNTHHDPRGNGYQQYVEKLQQTMKGNTIKNVDGINQKSIVKLQNADEIIQNVWSVADGESLDQFLQLVNAKQIPVDYQHSDYGVTMLMAVTVHGLVDHASELINRGADPTLQSFSKDCPLSAIEWACNYDQRNVLQLFEQRGFGSNLLENFQSPKFQRLNSYLKSVDEERVDLMLILKLIHLIHDKTDRSGAILVFLPGYDEIVTLKHLILNDDNPHFNTGTFRIFMLHSNIQTGDQRGAFQKPYQGVRKIVLSTNIAETSLTIEDIVYVIDSGRAKEKSFDSMTGVSQLKSVWISKASANQRRGRAGRCQKGISFHLFSSTRYESMAQYPIPEIVRTSLSELCLHARSFIREDITIDQFFAGIPEPPAPIAVSKSVDLLKEMGALDESELLTKLGHHLLDFPLEPLLGKALFYAVVFKCLDPILTIVAIISYRDPFQLPGDPTDKKRAHDRKKEFGQDSFSDHMVYLKAFQDWETAKVINEDTAKQFCFDHYLSPVSFEMIYAIRSQLIGQLRASGFIKTNMDMTYLNSNSNNWALVKGVLVATLYPNICGVNHEKKVLYNGFNSKITFHPSTIVAKKNEIPASINIDWIVYDEMTQQGQSTYVKSCTCVTSTAIALFAGRFQDDDSVVTDCAIDNNNYENGMDLMSSPLNLKINRWMTLYGNKDTIQHLVFLRKQVKQLLLKRLNSHFRGWNEQEEAVIQTIALLLAKEDEAAGFKAVNGIQQWPKLVSGNLMSAPRAGYEKTNVLDAFSSLSIVTNDRFFIAEVRNIEQAVSIMYSRIWLIPELLKRKLCDYKKRDTENKLKVVVFFWAPYNDKKVFTGAVRLGGLFEHLQEVPIEVLYSNMLGEDIINNAGLSFADFINRQELDFDEANTLLQLFSKQKK